MDPATVTALNADIGTATDLALAPRLPRPTAPARTVVTEFEPGHGFTTQNTASANLNDTTDFVSGTQSAYGISGGTGAQCSITRSNFGPFDMTGKVLEVLVKVTNTTHLNRIQFLLGNANFTSYYVQAVQSVASVAGEWLAEGEWTWLSVPWNPTVSGTPDRTAITDIRVAWADDSTGQAVKLQLDSIRFRPGAHPSYPNGVLTLCFDDNAPTQFTNAKPKMDQYGYPGVAYVIQDSLDTANNMTTAQLQNLERFSGWEVAAHSKNVADHNATGGLTSLTSQQLSDNFASLKRSLIEAGHQGADHFAYPQGLYNNTVLLQASRYFRTGRMAAAPRANELLPPEDPLKVRAWTSANDLPTLQGIVDQAKLAGSWGVIVFHAITNTVTNPTNETSVTNFNALVDYIATQGVPVRTMSDVLQTLNQDGASAASSSAVITTDPTKSAEVATMSRAIASGSAGQGTGSVMAGLAVCKTAGTYTKARVWCASAGSAVTGFKIGVWSSDGVTLRSETAHAAPAANQWLTRTLSTPLTLAAGDLVYLGVGVTFTTTTPTVRGLLGPGFGNYWPSVAGEGYYYYRGTANATWAGGTAALPGNLALNTGPAAVPLVELVP